VHSGGSGAHTVISVLVVEDHEMVGESFRRVLERESDLDVLDVVATLDAAQRLLSDVSPDVVLMDHDLPDGNGIDGARMVLEHVPDAKVLIVTGSTRGVTLLPRALDAGCCGYLSKTRGLDDLVAAVRSASAGDMVVPHDLMARVIAASRDDGRGTALTDREMDVLRLMASGRSNAEIAADLFLSTNTVRHHVQAVLQKLDAHSKLEAVAIALRRGLITVEEDLGPLEPRG
jgi:two-component system nitrate/nitrite response regulator NarL